jgi:hypothetical protein
MRPRIEPEILSKQCFRVKGREGIKLCGFNILRTMVMKNVIL